MKLRELLEAVKEKHLSKDQLEYFRDDMSNLYAQMQLELAGIRKAKAIYIFEVEGTISSRNAKWGASHNGQREIELSHYCKAVEKVLSSLKSRLYQVY